MTEATSLLPAMTAGVTRAGAPLEGRPWNILGQTYTLKQVSAASMAWDARFPPGTFVPPHSHPTQDEFVRVFEGTLSLWLDGQESSAGPGDLVRLPRGAPHGLFNRSDSPVTCLFWVAPTRGLLDLFRAIDGVPDPAEVVRLAALHEVHFLPPPA